MTNFSNYDISQARKTILVDFLAERGYDLIPEGSENFRASGHQGLIVKKHFWFNHSTNESGNAIDFLMKIEKLNFSKAVSTLLNLKCNDKVRWSFENDITKAKDYLIKAKKINCKIADQLLKLKKIKQDRANCICFIGYDDLSQQAYIFRRSMRMENNFKGEVKNSKKMFSFEITIGANGKIELDNTKREVEKLYIVEGAMDVCAMATLLKIKNKLARNEPIKIISTAGPPHISLKKRIYDANPKEIVIATDMDETGRQFAKTIPSWIEMENCSAPIYGAKDPSELLLKLKSK